MQEEEENADTGAEKQGVEKVTSDTVGKGGQDEGNQRPARRQSGPVKRPREKGGSKGCTRG